MVEGVFKACEIRYSKLNEEELLACFINCLNPKRADTLAYAGIQEKRALIDQILIQSPKASLEGFEFEGQLFKVVTLKELPISTETGMFTAELPGERAFPCWIY